MGPLEPIKLKGLYFPVVAKFPKIPLVALHVPGSPYVLISISQLCKEYCAAALFDAKAAYIWNADGVLATATVTDGLYVQDAVPQMADMAKILATLAKTFTIPTKATAPSHFSCLSYSLETLQKIHLASNHLAYSTLRKIHNFPPADKDNPNPVCQACCEAGIRAANIPEHRHEKPSEPWTHMTFDIIHARRKPPDHQGNQRAVIVADRHTDNWISIAITRKSEAGPSVLSVIKRINNRYGPNRIQTINCDGECPMSDDFRAHLIAEGIHLVISAPYNQWQNAAQCTMKRHQRAVNTAMHVSI